MTEKHKKQIAAWCKINTVPVYIKLNKNTDGDIIERLRTIGNKQGYIKKLIRNDISRKV